MRPFLTDPEICGRLAEVEARLRAIIRHGIERPYVEVGRCADDLHKLSNDLLPEVES